MNPLTEQQKNAPAGMSTIDGGYMSGYNPSLPSPTYVPPTLDFRRNVSAPSTASIATTNAEPTIAEQLSGIKSQIPTIQAGIDALSAQENQQFLSPTTTAYPTFDEIYGAPVDEERVRRDTLKMFQAQIDATNQAYDQMLAEERLQGMGRLGSQRAISARGGLLGSDFAASQKGKVQDYNTDMQRGIQAERTAAIGAILGTVRQTAAQEIANKNAARQQGAKNYLDYLANQQTRQTENLNSIAGAFVNQGIDPSTLDPAELQTIATEAGLNTNDLINTYKTLQASQLAAQAKAELEGRKTESEIQKNLAAAQKDKIVTLGEGTMLYNTETGETFKNPKTYAPGSASGLKIGGSVLSQGQVADVHELLNKTRGQPYQDDNGNWVTPPPDDRYANTKEYMNQFNGFVELGGDPKDFVKEYDPNIYINPNDPSRSFLQAYMKKSPQESSNEIEDLIQLRNSLSS